MTYALNEPFDDAEGRWDGFAPFDGTEQSDSAKGFLTTQKHVDLRCFRVIADLDPRPLSEVDVQTGTQLDAQTQTQLETKPAVNIVDEVWAIGGTGLNTMTVGEIATRGGWSGLQALTDGGAINATITSSITNAIDISPGTKLSIVFPDYNAFDTATSYVQLSSDPAGAFGTGHDSAQVFFSSNLAAMPELRLNVSAFAQSGFDNTKVTGVKIGLVKAAAPSAGLTFTMMAIRSLDPAWVESWLDFDTRIGAVYRPVTLDGNATTGTVAEAFQFVRGDGGKDDPIPADVAMGVYFYPGGLTSPNDATGVDYNTLAFIMREQKNHSTNTGSHIEAGVQFNDTEVNFYAKFVNRVAGVDQPDTGVYTLTNIVNGPFDSSKRYLMLIQLKGTQIIPKIYTVYSNGDINEVIWTGLGTITNTAYVYRNGRVGFVADLLSRDAYVDAINVSPQGFAELITETFTSRTPVDGAQLSAVYSSDLNLFTGFTSGATLDSTKTISGNGSYRSTGQMVMDTFLVDDWTQMYLDLSVWVSSAVTEFNQPTIILNGVEDPVTKVLDTALLKAAQWNNLTFDLGLFRDLPTGVSYFFSIKPGIEPDQPLGFYWVDEITIGRRRVSWAARATPTGLWREFKNTVNNPNGALHFTPEERGTQLQIKADALTQDAWVASFNLFPRYASLGLPLWDQGGTYENFDGGQ